MSILKVVTKQPGKPAQAAEIENGLESLQKFVGGYIQAVDFIGNTLMICNEEGKLEGLPVNFRFGSDIIVGSIIICGIDGENFGSLSDDEIMMALGHFNN